MYETLAWCVALVISELKLAVAPYDLEAVLEVTAGLDPVGVEIFRPYLYCASYLDAQGLLTEGEGAKFRVEAQAAAYRARQAQLDSALSLTVPPGTEAHMPTRAGPYSGSVPVTIVF